MKDDVKPQGTMRARFFARRVVVPSWLQVIFTATWLFCLVRMVINYPEMFAVAIILIVLLAVVQSTSSRQAAETSAYEEATTQREADTILWTRLRTYKVWHLVLICIVMAIFFLDLVGVFTF